jgi:hypothetical protein
MEFSNYPQRKTREIISGLQSLAPFVIAPRTSGKSTALVRFLGAKTILLQPERRYYIFVPSFGVAECLFNIFEKEFPNIDDINKQTVNKIRAQNIEVYFDEFELFSKEQKLLISDLIPKNLIKGGVSSLKTEVGCYNVEVLF